MSNRRGFTLVELIIVIVVIAILATVVALGLGKYLQDSRDTRREANVTTISEALEKYYDKNGEYPSCTAITASGTTVATNTLKGIDESALLVPNATTSNSIRCNATLATSGPDFIQYVGDGSSSCTSNGSCLSYKLRYLNEAEKAIREIESRRTASLATSGAIKNLKATTSCYTNISLTWAAIPNTSLYEVQRATDENFTVNLTSITTAANSANAASLTAGQQYFFRVRPTGSGQNGNWSNIADATTLKLGKPTLATTIDSTTQITANWNTVANAGCGGAATTYQLQRATNSDFTQNYLTFSNLTTTSHSSTGLSVGQMYYFRVRAVTATHLGDWSNVATSSTVPNPPTNVSVTVNSATQYAVSWTASTGATSYIVRYGTSSAANTYSATTTGTSLAISASILQGTTHYFQVFAASGGVEGTGSSIVSGTTPINMPAPYNMGGSTDGVWVNGSSPVSCPAGTTANFYWNANGGLWVQGTQHRNVGYYLNPGQGVTLQVATRCEKGGIVSGWRWSSNSYGYTRPGMNFSMSTGADNCSGGYCGRIVNASWNNICGTGAPRIYSRQLSAYANWIADSPSNDSIRFKGGSAPGVLVEYYDVNIGCTSAAGSIYVISAYKCSGCR